MGLNKMIPADFLSDMCSDFKILLININNQIFFMKYIFILAKDVPQFTFYQRIEDFTGNYSR